MVADVGMTRSRNNWAFGSLIVAAIAAALFLLLVIGPPLTDPWWQGVVKDIAIAMLLAVAVTGFWRLRGNRMFAEEVLELQHVGESAQNWGLRELSMDWESVDWKGLFEHASQVDIIHGYGYTWSGGSRQLALEAFAAKRGRKLRVALPDPGSDWVMTALAKRFFTTEDVVKARIEEAASRYLSLRKARGGADIRVYYREGEPLYAAYKFDADLVMTLYTHRKAKIAEIPVVRVRGGDLAKFVQADFDEVFRISSEVPAAEGAIQ
ncbi:hypothetical protein [Agromyces kandeliae]|uniref:Uncharacterized protein n=1 Tax=Agromyces kandeliae TaxID=2666141 RepID=A0A6L5R576_9MICO|nr:hypothetical protein [Agromyces kandeliae]MRX44508.1 hypothetical protein [Agromyces kandeliae]